MYYSQILWLQYVGEFWDNLPGLARIVWWITLGHIAALWAWCEFGLRRWYPGAGYMAHDMPFPYAYAPAWLAVSYATLAGGVCFFYPLYCLWQAVANHFLVYLYFTGQPIPWPLSLVFNF